MPSWAKKDSSCPSEENTKCVDLINKVILTELRDEASGREKCAVGDRIFAGLWVCRGKIVLEILHWRDFFTLPKCWRGITRIKMSTIGTSRLGCFFAPFHHDDEYALGGGGYTCDPWFSSVRFARRHRVTFIWRRQQSKVRSKTRITLRELINDCEMKNRQKFFIAVTLCSAPPSSLARPQKANRYGKHSEWQTEKQLEKIQIWGAMEE